MSKFHKNTIYKVKRKVDRHGNISYRVQGANSWFGAIINCWDYYSQDNDSVDQAIEQIEEIDKHRLASNKTVYRVKIK